MDTPEQFEEYRECREVVEHLTDILAEQRRTLEGRIERLRNALIAIATMDCLTREDEEPAHLLLMRLAREALDECRERGEADQ